MLQSDLEVLPANEPLRNWHINTDVVPPEIFDLAPQAFQNMRVIDDCYKPDLPASATEWFEKNWKDPDFLARDICSPQLKSENCNRGDELFFKDMLIAM